MQHIAFAFDLGFESQVTCFVTSLEPELNIKLMEHIDKYPGDKDEIVSNYLAGWLVGRASSTVKC